MLRNIFIIMKREYLERVRTRAFVIMTFLIPLLMFGASVVPTLLANRGSDDAKHLMVVAADRDTAEMIRSRIELGQDKNKDQEKVDKGMGQKRGIPSSRFTIEVGTDTSDSQRKELTEKVKQKQLDGFIWATPAAIAAKKIDFVTRDVSSFLENIGLQQSVSDALRRQALKNKGLSDQDIESALK